MKTLFISLFLCLSIIAQAQTGEIQCKVTDASGEALVGAAIKVTAHKQYFGSVTDIDGNYIVKVPAGEYSINVSYTGYNTQQIDKVLVRADSITIVNIQLSEDTRSLGDVIIVGLGTPRSLKSSRGTQKIDLKVRGSRSTSTAYQIDGKAPSQHLKKSKKKAPEPKDEDYNTESYSPIIENEFLTATQNPLSTFSIDVDRASYSNARRYFSSNTMPPVGSVRAEEFVNYFEYDYPNPKTTHPFSFTTELSSCPWNPQHQLLMIGMQGKRVETEKLPASNLVFLIDVSGSMSDENKLPLVKESLHLLVNQLRPQDRIAIVVYAGAAGEVLPSTSGSDKATILAAIDDLGAGGSTAGGAGIELAYSIAQKNFLTGGNNRVILATDGDFNMGASSHAELFKLIEDKRKTGVFITCLGYGMGNYKDDMLEGIADKGNGNYAYIDNINEAKKTLVKEMGGTLVPIAKDVKLQLEFNPTKVQAYRLVGYENRLLATEDFADDTKDAGELGMGHTVTAFYEIIPIGTESEFVKPVTPLKYQKNTTSTTATQSTDLMTIKFRYKRPQGNKSVEMVQAVAFNPQPLDQTSNNFRFASSVALFAMQLNNSKFTKQTNWDAVLSLAKNAIGEDKENYRKDFVQLVEKAKQLKP